MVWTVIVGVPLAGLVGMVAAGVLNGVGALLVMAVPTLILAVVLGSLTRITIGISVRSLSIRNLLLGVRIPIADIRIVNDTALNSRLSWFSMNFATAPGWLEIGYLVRGKTRWVTVSPADKLGLMQALADLDPAFAIGGGKLEREM